MARKIGPACDMRYWPENSRLFGQKSCLAPALRNRAASLSNAGMRFHKNVIPMKNRVPPARKTFGQPGFEIMETRRSQANRREGRHAALPHGRE